MELPHIAELPGRAGVVLEEVAGMAIAPVTSTSRQCKRQLDIYGMYLR
jgi:hypothetical protein